MNQLDSFLHDLKADAIVLIIKQRAASYSPALVVQNKMLQIDLIAAGYANDLFAEVLAEHTSCLALASAGWTMDSGGPKGRSSLTQEVVGLLGQWSVDQSIGIFLKFGTVRERHFADAEDDLALLKVGPQERFPVSWLVSHEGTDDVPPAEALDEPGVQEGACALEHITSGLDNQCTAVLVLGLKRLGQGASLDRGLDVPRASHIVGRESSVIADTVLVLSNCELVVLSHAELLLGLDVAHELGERSLELDWLAQGKRRILAHEVGGLIVLNADALEPEDGLRVVAKVAETLVHELLSICIVEEVKSWASLSGLLE